MLNGKEYPPRRYRLIEEEVARYSKLLEDEKQFLLSVVRDTLTRYKDSRSNRWVLLYSFNALRRRRGEGDRHNPQYTYNDRATVYRDRLDGNCSR